MDEEINLTLDGTEGKRKMNPNFALEAEALSVAANRASDTLEGNAPTYFENEELRRAYCGLLYQLKTVALFAAQVQELEEENMKDKSV